MKRIIPISILKMLVVICLFVLGTAYSQDKKQSDIILFGKQITPETINPKNGIIRCGTTEYEKMLQEKNPKRMTQDQFESWLAPLVQKNATMRTAQTNAVITIPVVVHVISNGQAVGIDPNITDAQVQSQITVLNQDFGRTGPGFNTNPVGVDTQIRFVLAQQDPYGKVTNGIDRVSFVKESWSTTDIESILKPATFWDPTQYLNLWTVQFTDSKFLGYAQFPDASGLSGISNNGIANTDGVVIKYNAFGSGSGEDFLLKAPYNKGRTATHEIGHWLGLIHIWGDGSDCAKNTDYCADTPVAKDPNYGCPTGTNSCPTKTGVDMIENYMDYTDDSCMNIFTKNQKDRMDVIMNNAARRKSLKTSIKGFSIKPTLTAVADRDEYVDTKCEFEIPDYTYLTTATDISGGTVKSLEQSPKGGTKTIKGKGTVELITLTATDNKENSDFITFKITLKEKDIFLFPNPTKETIKISTSLCALTNSYTIANSLGQIILQKEVSAATDLNIDTSSLSNGIYFITVTKENEKKTLRFIKD